MRRIAGIGIICIAFGMFMSLIIRNRMAVFFVIIILAAAGFLCFYDD